MVTLRGNRTVPTDMHYADILLPLPLRGTFTYEVPPGLRAAAVAGKRAVVQFGAKKEYSGVITSLHFCPPPAGVAVKPVIAVLDEEPVATPGQLSFWKWMAAYYLCTEGEVMKAALPAGLKLASESVVGRSGGYDGSRPLTPRERAAAEILEKEGEMTVAALQKKCGGGNIMPVVRSLYDKGAVRMREELRGGCRPRRETRVTLGARCLGRPIEEARVSLARAPLQLRLFEEYLAMSGAAAAESGGSALLRPVAKSGLLRRVGSGGGAALGQLLKKGILAAEEAETARPQCSGGGSASPNPLSEAQAAALASVRESFRSRDVCLLHGVTSSGKTEIYIHLIDEAVRRGESVLYLLPEIALATQITQRLRLFFGGGMGVFHSELPDSERVEIWKKQLSPEPYKLIVGARSSVFLPMRRLGLVIIDEEHETSYKQDEPAPRYNARDAAIMLARMSGAKALLGTATPSLESYANALSGKYGLAVIKERFAGSLLPEIRVEDVQELRRKKMMSSPLSPRLISEMRSALQDGGQAILFQNRRGYSPLIACRSCGWVPRCEHCDVSLTYHRGAGKLMCHYCGASYSVPETCPACGEARLDCRGTGTEKVEEAARKLFPEARVARLDLDTTRARSACGRILSDFRDGRTDILIGTQMVSKGLDFGRVRVVGVLDADSAMNAPDFRSYERAFQMMSQVAGRAGRRDVRGTVIIQTRRPDAELIAQVAANDYEGMYRVQMREREMFGYPPFCRLIYVYIRHRSEYAADCASREAAAALRPLFGGGLLGPASPPVARVKSMFIRQLMLKAERSASVSRVRSALLDAAAAARAGYGADVYFDADPL